MFTDGIQRFKALRQHGEQEYDGHDRGARQRGQDAPSRSAKPAITFYRSSSHPAGVDHDGNAAERDGDEEPAQYP
jgi:hypothetical protein